MSKFINAYSRYFGDKNFDATKLGTSECPIPKFSSSDILNLCKLTRSELSNDKSLLSLAGDFTIVGDLHGNIRDLIRIFALAGSPLTNKYLFVGDYVDRGNFSIEVVTLLLALKHEHPDSIFLLRGNHEFEEMNGIYGFREECLKEYGLDAYDACNKCFALMPFAAILNGKVFVVHGGLSPTLLDTCQIMSIPKPVITYKSTPYEQLVTNIVWSDPTTTTSNYGPSTRKMGCTFGITALKNFLSYNKLQVLIRGHQCVQNGVEKFENDHLYTVFSSSSYSKSSANKSGIIQIIQKHIKCFNFPAIPVLKREDAVFEQLSHETRPRKNTFTLGTSVSPVKPNGKGSLSPVSSQTTPRKMQPSSLPIKEFKSPRPGLSSMFMSPSQIDSPSPSGTPSFSSERSPRVDETPKKVYPLPKSPR